MKRFSIFYVGRIVFTVLVSLSFNNSSAAEAQDKRPSELVAADGTKLRYVVDGSGIPCVVVNGSHYQRVFPKDLRRHLKLIFLDFRHSYEPDAAGKLETLTLDSLFEDIEQVRKALGFERIAVMGHSLPSAIAVEYARKFPQHTSHLILIGAPPFLIPREESQAFWESDASEARKLADKRNLEKISDEDIKKAPTGQAWKLYFVRSGAHYWYDPSYDSSWLLEGIAPNMNFMPRVAVLLGNYDVEKRTPRVTTPVFLAIGRYDYLVPYHSWKGRKDSFPNLSYNLFEKSGHYAMFEEPALFEQKLIGWMKRNK